MKRISGHPFGPCDSGKTLRFTNVSKVSQKFRLADNIANKIVTD